MSPATAGQLLEDLQRQAWDLATALPERRYERSQESPDSSRDPVRPSGRGDRPDTTFRKTKTRLGGSPGATANEGTQQNRPGPTQGRGR